MSAYVYRRVRSLKIHHEGHDLGSEESIDLVQSQFAAIIEHLHAQGRVGGVNRIEKGSVGRVVLTRGDLNTQSKLKSENRQRKATQSSRRVFDSSKRSIEAAGLQKIARAAELRRFLGEDR